jgi:hypothetical protein
MELYNQALDCEVIVAPVLTAAEGWVLCTATVVLAVSLAGIAATGRGSKRRGHRRRLSGQFALAFTGILLGYFAPGVPRVALAVGLLIICCSQTLLGREPVGLPTLISRRAS